MNLTELIDAHGPVMAAESAVGMVVCYAADGKVFTVATSDMNGAYEVGEQYDAEGGTDFEAVEEEANELLTDCLGSVDETDNGEENANDPG